MLTSRTVNIAFAISLLVAAVLAVVLKLSLFVIAAHVLLYLIFQAYGASVLSAGYFVPVKFRGRSGDAIAITFDDGPHETMTPAILDVLKDRNVKAGFFCIGNRVDKHPDLIRRADEEGHIIGNHSYWHGKLFDLQSAPKMVDELTRTDRSIEAVIGRKPRFFRPPYGVTNPMLAKAIRKGNYVTVGWSVRSFDTVIKDTRKLSDRVVRSLKGGDIVLFHDHGPATLQLLPGFIDAVRAIGFKIVRVDEIVEEKPYAEQ